MPPNPFSSSSRLDGLGVFRPSIRDRKAEHIAITTAKDVEPPMAASWSDVMLMHNCLPEVDYDDVDLSVEFLGRRLAAPLIISSMTGGHELARSINAVLAQVAGEYGLAMGVGSQRAYLRDRSMARSYTVVRDVAPRAFMIGNVGAPQLIAQPGEPPLSTEDVRSLIELIHADGLAIHLNYLQEMVQPEGDTRAQGVVAAIERVVQTCGVPVIAKETGAGVNTPQARQLAAAGVRAIDVGGLGGTSFAIVEGQRAKMRRRRDKVKLGDLLAGWGIPTMVSIPLVAEVGLPVVGSGGIRSGLDAARALALGASMVGVARPLLVAAQHGVRATRDWVDRFLEELRTVMFLTGSHTPADLRGKAVITGRTHELLEAFRER